MSQRLQALAKAIRTQTAFSGSDADEKIEVSKPASTAATLYEKVRVSIDYQEEHLLRRNAILRIIKRFVGSDTSLEDIAKLLLRELIWAKYLPNKEVPVRLEGEVAAVIGKYEPLLRATDDISEKKDVAFDWVLDVMSTELEYLLTPPVGDEALVSYMYDETRKRIEWDASYKLSDEEKELILYIAIHKTLLKSNTATLRFRVMTLYYPKWPGPSALHEIQAIATSLEAIIERVERYIHHPMTEKMTTLLRRRAGLFRVVGDVVADEHGEAAVGDPAIMDREVAGALKKRTKTFKKKLNRTVLRAILFLFITKMLLALIIELPYDLWIAHEEHLWPLAVNVLFPPFFLATLALTIHIPEKRNTADYKEAARALVVGADHALVNVRVKRKSTGPWATMFNTVYLALFVFIYVMIGTFLANIGFNWLSITLFLMFLSLVGFFGVRIRSSTRDVILSPSRRGLIGTLFDMVMTPIVQAGRWLSVKVSKINVFIYFFDFIIEAPFKVAVRFFEGWLDFMREKKEEI